MDWNTVIKPLLTNRYGVLNKTETINIIKAITRCENDFLDEESNNARFYIAFAALAADKLSQCKLVCQTQVPQIQEACYVLIRFILNKLQKVNAYELKWLLSALKSLCEAKSNAQTSKASISTTSSSTSCTSNLTASQLQFDYNAVVATLRNIKYPEASKTIVTSSDKDSPKSEIKRSRSDLSSVILQQLTAPLEAGKITWAPLSEEFTDCSDFFASNNVSYLQSLNGVDTILNICLTLASISSFDNKFQEAVASSNRKQIYLPLSQAEALIIKKELIHMVTDVSILWQVLSLPILEPLTPQRIVTLSKLALAALYCGVTASIACSMLSMTSSSSGGSNTTSGSSLKSGQPQVGVTSATNQQSGQTKEQTGVVDDADEQARFIVDKAIEIYTMVGEFYKNNASSYVYHNHLCYGAWMLVTGIHGALGASGSNAAANNTNKQQPQTPQQQTSTINQTSPQQQPSSTATTSTTDEQNKNKSGATFRTPETPTIAPTTGRVNLFKVQQGFGVLNVAIANYCIKLLSELIEHLKVETTFYDAVNFSHYSATTSATGANKEALPEAANFEILQQHSPLQRTMRILNTTTLHQLFTFLATVSYRKACALKRAHAKDRTECEPISFSDSTTYFNDSLSCSDNSEEDDSESYLGNWFKETLSPEQNDDGGSGVGTNAQGQERNGDQQKSNLVGDEPHEYLDLSAKIFAFLELFFANKHTYLHSYVKAGLSEQQMLLLANILKDLDRDAARGEPELGVCVKWQAAMVRFSGAVGRYLHNLISAGLLSESLQSNLLQNLNVSPWLTESNAWPLQVYPSTLSVLVQILLLKPTQEKEAACLWVWHRLINTLVEGVCATSVTSTAADADYEDLNMEHAQLLLFLFHSLNLMQKKSILLLTAGGVIRCAEVCRGISADTQIRNSQIMSLSRLLLFLEYLMKHLYNAPPELLDQVRWNLFSISTMGSNQKLTDLYNNKTKLMSFCHKNIEDCFRKGPTEFTSNIRPTFYSLTVIDSTSTPNNEFKLDGLAWNFILCTPDKLKYPMLVDALINILSVIDMSSYSVNTHALCAMHYCFSICWKLLLGLPPSTQHVEALMQPITPNLHSLLWSIRCTMSTAKYLISSSLIKQGMYTQFAENLWNSVCAQVSGVRSSMQQTLLGVKNFVDNLQKDQPTLSQIVLLDALVAHMEAVAFAQQENIKPPRVASNNALTTGTAAEKDTALTSDTNCSGNNNEAQNSNKNTSEQQEQEIGENPTIDELSCDLLQELINAYNAISGLVRDKMKVQLSDNIPTALLDLIIPIVGKHNRITNDVHCWFLKLITERDREVVTLEWSKSLQVSESAFDGQSYPVEEYTLSVIEAHVRELIRCTTTVYNQLNSLKHTLLSILQLIYYLLPLADATSSNSQSQLKGSAASSGNSTPECKKSMQLPAKNYPLVREQLKSLLVATMLDMRMNNLYNAAERSIMAIAATNMNLTTDQQQQQLTLLKHEYTLRHLYKLMLALCADMRQAAKQSEQSEAAQSKHSILFTESMLYATLRSMTQMADTSEGLQAMRNFFARTNEGNLVELLLCFEGTTMSLAYVREHLQFVEKLFAQTEREPEAFPIEELRACFGDLAQVEEGRIKAWLSHVIYGNTIAVSATGGGLTSNSMASDKAQASSTPSSNAQTPTNMATVSAAMPSLVSEEQVENTEDIPVEVMAEAMDVEIDEEGMAVAVPSNVNNDVATQSQPQEQQIAAPQTSNNNNNSSNNNNNMWTAVGGANSYITTINNSEPTSPEQETTGAGGICSTTNERNGALLLRLINHIVGDGKSLPGVSMLLFQSLLQLGQSLIAPPHETADFADLLKIMISLADTAQARGHATLFNATIMWLEITKFQVLERALTAKSTATTTTTATNNCNNNLDIVPSITLENISALLRYLSELLQSLGYKGSKNIAAPWDDELLSLPLDNDDMCLEDGMEFLGADDDGMGITASTLGGTDDDEESLNNKLCTFSQTQKEFMNQHWYHCHTCNMVNTVGVCSVCARVCHKGHDVSYAKYGNFFCDCGAKEDGSCQALVRRTTTTTVAEVRTHTEYLILGGKKRLTTPPPPPPPLTTTTLSQQQQPQNERIVLLSKLLESSREQLQNKEQWSQIVRCILDFFDVLLPAISENCALYSIVGCHKRAQMALSRLHTPDKLAFEWTDNLMLPTLGSQEGAFENVRMSYSGDQGQTIKQLLSSGLVRRVALCCLSAPQGKRQHLAVSHEKNKVTILQLSALLKQADAAKRKLTLTQLAAAPIPCTVLSLTANPANEDCLAVCGLKECHILTFASNGATNEHLVLTPQLENGNFIKKALWLPGAQTLLALVTADYVKIYDLAEDAYSPKYYFLVAVGKIRDCTFVYQSGVYYMLLIASSGYIYYQTLDEQSLAKHGDFYVTNTLELNHPQIKDVSGQVDGGGVSIYYSHTLQLLFFSYSIGRSFMAPLIDVNKGVESILLLQTSSASKLGSANATNKAAPQALCQWTEIAGHPGLICAMFHTSNNPVIFMLTPERISVQEIKAQSSKARIMDMVAIRHTVAGLEKTTLILLCEDGSLRIFTASPETTNYWLSPQVQPVGNQLFAGSASALMAAGQKGLNSVGGKRSKRKTAAMAAAAVSAQQQKALATSGTPVFPIDYFEHCSLLPELEFGGNDLLQIYNKQKLKTRLFSAGMFVVSTKPNGFTLEVLNNDANVAIVGIRVLIGTQDILRAPQTVNIMGRVIQTPVRRARWFDIPLTREEILQSDKCLKVGFGKSQDPENICMLDSIEVYGKSKELLAWPDDVEESNGATTAAVAATNNNNNVGNIATTTLTTTLATNLANVRVNATPFGDSNLDRMLSHLLDVLDCSLQLLGGNQVIPTIKTKATRIATTLLLLPTAAQVQLQIRYVIATIFGNRNAYHQFKDFEVLKYVFEELKSMQAQLKNTETLCQIDPEHFYRLILLVRSIASARASSMTRICSEQNYDIVGLLKTCVEQLYLVTPNIEEPTSIVRRGLCHPELIVHCLMEIIYAFALYDVTQVQRMTKYVIELLKHDSSIISHSAKEALILLLGPRMKRRKVAIVTPPTCTTPTPNASALSVVEHAAATAVEQADSGSVVESIASGVVEAAGASAAPSASAAAMARSNSAEYVDAGALDEASQQMMNLDAFMGLQLLGLQQDADEEAIMDIAIALSLQQHDGEALQSLQQGLANLRNAGLPAALDGANIAHAASVSQGGSDDDEASNVATDGSTLRTSPAEAVGSGGSESGGSGVESIGGQSGRSSTYGDPANASPPRSVASSSNAPQELPSSSKSSVSGIASSVGVGGAGGSACIASIDEAPSTSAIAAKKLVEENMASEALQGDGVAQEKCDNDDFDDNESEDANLAKLHDLRLAILDNIIQNIPTFDNCNGIQAIPIIQVILMLTTDLNSNNERDQQCLTELITALVQYVETSNTNTATKMKERNAKNEVRLVLLCLFGVLMGKTKSKQTGTTSPPHQFKDNTSFVANTTATILSSNGAINFSMLVMETMLQHWKRVSTEQSLSSANNSVVTGTPPNNSTAACGTGSSGTAATANSNNNNSNSTNASPTHHQLLKVTRYGPKPDISTLIPHNYLKNYPDIFECYESLLTETCVRLPYQILRLTMVHAGSFEGYSQFCENMTYTLCEYMMLNLNALLRRQVRKLLMYICGSKEKFRMYRDGHSLNVHFNFVKSLCGLTNTKNVVLSNHNIPILSYDSLVELTEHLRTCQEIAQIRTGNWQKFCLRHEDVIPVLIDIVCYQLDDGVSPIILQLLQSALCNNVVAVKQSSAHPTAAAANANQSNNQNASQSNNYNKNNSNNNSSSKQLRSEREKSEEMADGSHDSKFDPTHCSAFVHQIFRYVSDGLLNKFVRIFLLETNITSIRWQAHALIFAIYEHSNERQKEKLISVLWNLWPLVPAYGRRTAQFVDILGYLTLSTHSIASKLPEYTQHAVEVLRQQNDLLCKHPNAPIYTTLEQILQVNGYYLESEPCLVCNNPEVPMANIKLPSIKSDSKFTTTNMIVKLVQSHTISKLIVRIADLKRTKMVRTLNIYYNNRTVQAVVELKNRPALWHKARTVTLQSGQTEVKIDFPLPITACNLMIEYADFYETVTGSSENLQCPRCSAAVPAYPGVCANCGENVFQCHKCRAINYDEKDPFLCHSCGFCKYAKFDFSIYGRVCCAVDPIESAEDRAKTVQIIHTSLERADRIYRQLQTNKQMLELLVQKVSEHRCQDRLVDDNLGTVHTTSQVNKIIQLLAQKYCVESRSSFEELSKIVQKVKACRSELVAYDRSQQDQHTNKTPNVNGCENYITNRCYGCALASTEQCLTLLRAMASNYECRVVLYAQGLVGELALHNLRRGTPQIQDEVRNLLVLLTKNNKDACENLLALISERVKTALLGVIPLANLDAAIHHEMVLLEVLIAQDDFCWEQKVKVVFELFLLTCRSPRGPTISVLQPCLRILQALICPIVPTSKMNRDLTATQLATIGTVDGLTVDHEKWLANDALHNYDMWKARMPSTLTLKAPSPPRSKGGATTTVASSTAVNAMQEDRTMAYVYKKLAEQSSMDPNNERLRDCDIKNLRRELIREAYLTEKYARRWRQHVLDKNYHRLPLELSANWLQPVMFNTNSRFGRQLACSLATSLSRTHECKRELLNLLTSFLKHVGEVGEASAEFLTLYRAMATDTPWRQYLALSGVLLEISQLLSAEIVKIHRLEETTLSSDLSQGYALRQFVELLSLFLECPNIRQTYKTRLLGPVLEGYLSLRKLVVQRTRLIDDAQEKLLEMLEEMTSGTEEETRAFMEILIDTVEKTRLDDIKTPVFIFERLYSIIHPEEYDETEFYMTLEKDPQQEDFLQGRMLGNPYGSTELGLGPLMRDVKNKICTDCELIALLEDDNGMELLVNNKIISLDLPVKDVYKKVWLAEGGERDAMRIVYRMRGLLGDATEEFVETLNNKSQEEVDTEQLYRLANVLADCNGLKVMLDRIGNLQSISRTRELIQVLLKLFLICVKVRRCQAVLCQPELGAINTLLKVLQMCLQSETDSIQSAVTEQLLEIMETILSKAASDTLDSFLQFSLTFGGPEYVSALISCTDHANVRHNPSVLRHLIRVLAALVYGNEVKMALLCAHFQNILDFDRFDVEHSAEEEFKLELFCVLTNQIEHNCIGGTLKDYIVGLGIVERAIEYIVRHAPCVKPTLLRTDSDELKEFISRPSLKYILRFLTGLAHKHEATQLAISKVIIPIIHRLEQVSSDEHVGSLAENLLEALCTDVGTAQRVQEVRDFTRTEKKRLAMATREKQLDALGMRTNEKGQVTAKGSILQKIEKLRDETGLTCFICREGYACQPAKVLGIYTFTKRCNVEEYELKSRKTLGYTTVTHFNVVHVDCHTSAIRLARGRDEWDRASLQNANTRCNGLLPLWGPDVTDAAFSACMTRHTSYMQESTSRCDINFPSSIHDLKLLLMRFAWERSFHDDAGGGGPQSNMHFVPYLLFYAVYLLLSSRSAARDSKTLMNYLTASISEKWLECAHEVEGPLYMLTISLALHSHETWQKHKLAHLKRLITTAQARYVSPSVQCKSLMSSNDRQAKEYAVYKPYLMMWSLVDLIYGILFKTVVNPKEEDWSISLFDFIRKNDETMLKSTDNILQTFTEEFLPCTSFAEFCDVAGLLHLIENPDSFIDDIMNSLPSASPANTNTATGSGSSS